MEVVTSYKAADGKIFENAEECIAHEARLAALQAGLEDFLKSQNLLEDEVLQAHTLILDWEVHKHTRTPPESSLQTLDLTVRSTCILRENNVRSLEALTQLTETALLRFHGMGPKCINDIKGSLAQRGLSLRAEL
jgi:DNA-directed RNA polymerase alpha subunit